MAAELPNNSSTKSDARFSGRSSCQQVVILLAAGGEPHPNIDMDDAQLEVYSLDMVSAMIWAVGSRFESFLRAPVSGVRCTLRAIVLLGCRVKIYPHTVMYDWEPGRQRFVLCHSFCLCQSRNPRSSGNRSGIRRSSDGTLFWQRVLHGERVGLHRQKIVRSCCLLRRSPNCTGPYGARMFYSDFMPS